MIIIIQLEHLFPPLGPNLCKVATFPSNFCPLAKIKILLKNICISILYLNMQSQFLNIKYAVQNPEYYIPNTKMPSKIQNTTSPYTKYAVQYPKYNIFYGIFGIWDVVLMRHDMEKSSTSGVGSYYEVGSIR